MKFAILSDVHGNIFALQEVFKIIPKLTIEALIWSGDYITDIPCSHEVLAFMQEKAKEYQSFMIRGNREDYILDYHDSKIKTWSMENRGGPLLCCYRNLSEKDLKFLSHLPTTYKINLPNVPKIFVSHKRNEIDGNDCEYKIFGHSHQAELFLKENIQYINPGSIGMPVGTKGKTTFCTLEINENNSKIENYQIKYDIQKVIALIEKDALAKVAIKWGNALIQTLQTGKDYCKMYVEETIKIAKKRGIKEDLDTIPIEVWHEARKNLGF